VPRDSTDGEVFHARMLQTRQGQWQIKGREFEFQP
jgi:hypothetical protein